MTKIDASDEFGCLLRRDIESEEELLKRGRWEF